MTRHTAKSNPTSEAEKEEIVRLREGGMSKAEIARRMCKSLGTVSHWCLTLGAEPPSPAKPLSPRTDTTFRAGKTVRPFSPEDDRRMLDWAGESLPYAEIARRLGRATTSIRYRLLTLARHDGLRDR